MLKYHHKVLYWGGVCALVFVTLSSSVLAQSRNREIMDYIRGHYQEAIYQMNKYGIPASVKLAQAVLETGGGKSSLAQDFNNHFGIKCHRGWTGARTYKTDDVANECFRVYNNWESSYDDHSKFLLAPRYASLFRLSLLDYRDWCKGLQACGYASNKGYANSLINLIELYELYAFDQGKSPSWMSGNKSSYGQSDPQIQRGLALHPIYVCYGLHYTIAKAGDTIESICDDFGLRSGKISRYNEIPENYPLQKGDIVYLDKKHKHAIGDNYEHVVRVGDSMHSIAQEYGMRIKTLYELNNKDDDYYPMEGDVLRLQ